MTGVEMVLETLVHPPSDHMTWLLARESRNEFTEEEFYLHSSYLTF